jgi:hypothetical protein
MRLFALFVALGLVGCDPERPPRAGSGPTGGTEAEDVFFVLPDPEPPDPDAGWLCGSLVVPIHVERPNFYFVLDASGSMAAPPDPPLPYTPTVYLAARAALAEVLRAVGHRVMYGAALFPGAAPTFEAPCPAGTEVFATRAGDDVRYALAGEDGPVLTALLRVLGARSPQGTTPTSATLRALRPGLEALEGDTFVFLITDGAPNCNQEARCGAEACEANLVGACTEGVNCCSPDVGPYAHLGCIDADPTVQAVGDLTALGIHTFVIGLPGTAAFGEVLDRLALAGGTGRDRPPYYYPIHRADQLADVLRGLAADVAIDCHVELAEPPPDRRQVNVYFDQTLVHQHDEDGWRWASDRRIEMAGASCETLKSGSVLRVQVAAGCPTEVR